ncbi:serine protease grass-like [Topomyia yanbarensis]|uniref:serine protease grass-like n=1 Tax=Topomyia yanbarensis TaxID=2498891 RepID=UPI00273CAAB2|nr:serine protease grass-like [Topomyia yanbarensis]
MDAVYYLGAIIVLSAIATSESCVTPSGSSGKCVPLQQCSNLFALTQLAPNITDANVVKYLKNAECISPNSSEKKVCCQPDRIFQLPDNCGLASSERIAHGNETAVFEYPWMALLMYRNLFSDEIMGNCGGTLISERYVLTAAHCLKDDDQFKLEFVRLGEHTISEEKDCNNIIEEGIIIEQDCAGPVENVRYELYIIHPQYRSAFTGNDIGLIRLAETIIFKSHIMPICLPMTAVLKDLLLPEYIVAGWGLTEKLTRSDVLLQAQLPRLEQSRCQKRISEIDSKKHNITVNEKQICAGGRNLVDSCQGDSGGPLMWPAEYLNRTRYVQFGVVSYGINYCGEINFPGVYARVGSYLGWILANMKA